MKVINLYNGFKIRHKRVDEKNSSNLKVEFQVTYDEKPITAKIIYETMTEGLTNVWDVIIPEYVKNHNITNVKLLSNKGVVKNVAIMFLERNRFTYLTTINMMAELGKLGFVTYKHNDRLSKDDLDKFYKAVTKLTRLVKKYLREFGYDADMNTKDKTDHKEWEVEPGCKNLIYIRSPWYAAMKAGKTINKMSNPISVVNGSMKEFKESEEKMFDEITSLGKVCDKVIVDVNASIITHEFSTAFESFKKLTEKEHKRLIGKWSKRVIPTYGNYKTV